MKNLILCMTTVAALIKTSPAESKIWGKVEAGPAFVHLDIIDNSKTVSKMDMPAFRADSSIIIGSGWCIKPTLTYGKNGGEFLTTGIGVGHCLPWGDKLIFTPTVGVSYTLVHTSLHVDVPFIGDLKFREKFESTAPYIGLDATWLINDCWRLCGVFQYAWSHSHTTIENTLTKSVTRCTSDSKGPNFGLLLEHDFNKQWSINAGVGWNISLSRDHCGIRGRGAKIAIVRWF